MADEPTQTPEQQRATLQQQAEAAIAIVDRAVAWSDDEQSSLSPRDQVAQNQQAWTLIVQIVRQALASAEPQPTIETAPPNRQTRRANGRKGGNPTKTKALAAVPPADS